ncbi:MAG TPA: hypothetical protein PLX89_06935 [Verrucomicrobiota bacterium]|nr:hypothetical protein [Verrucomicrobiales bacterium]HRI12726.1 hypothetical protein [Verrucomicrobiota bacterium]
MTSRFARLPSVGGWICCFLLWTLNLLAQTAPSITAFELDVRGRGIIRVPYEEDAYYILYRGDELWSVQTIADLSSATGWR